MKPVLIGMTCYGDHIDTFLNVCLPSLMAEGNLPSLAKERDIMFSIHTKKEDLSRLMGCVEYRWGITCDATESEKYSQLGYHQNSDLQKAKKLGADYICLMPDYVYSENCFRGILKALDRGHKAIGRLVVSTKMEPMLSALKPNISAKELATLSLMHIHSRIRNWLITPTGYPATHVIAYVGKDTLSMHSPHIHPVYIANEVIKSSAATAPLDCALDSIIEGDIYCPQPEDGIVIVELTPEANGKPQLAVIDENEFLRVFRWDTNNSAKQLAIFKQGTVDAIDREMIGNDNYWTNEEISGMKDRVSKLLKGG